MSVGCVGIANRDWELSLEPPWKAGLSLANLGTAHSTSYKCGSLYLSLHFIEAACSILRTGFPPREVQSPWWVPGKQNFTCQEIHSLRQECGNCGPVWDSIPGFLLHTMAPPLADCALTSLASWISQPYPSSDCWPWPWSWGPQDKGTGDIPGNSVCSLWPQIRKREFTKYLNLWDSSLSSSLSYLFLN